jgi:hypothetical protein
MEIETETDSCLPFLNIDIDRRPDGSLDREAYQKLTHRNLYLNARSHHHPSSKQAILVTLVHRARSLCNRESLHDKLEGLVTTFRLNGYSQTQIQHAMNPPASTSQPIEKLSSFAFPPYVQMAYGHISRMLAKDIIRCVQLLPREISSFLHPLRITWG